ncbi:hypothetical protein PENSPDRAFT_679037 [Peniophora sp. CONT]|nr:hypothetical protein PENSPDRAFT_679037 [Peniophora sp. CONT]
MPAIAADYEVILLFSNDTREPATVQLARDYHCGAAARHSAIVLLWPGDKVSLILAAGSTYRYVLKTGSKLASLSINRWRDATVTVADAFSGAGSPGAPASISTGVTVDRVWRDGRMMLWDSEPLTLSSSRS